MRSIEIYRILEEVKNKLINKKVVEVFNSKNFFSIKVGDIYLNIFLPYFFFLDEKPITTKKSKFSIILQNLILNEIVEEINQINLERIVEIKTRNIKIILKLFDKGNIIVLNNENKILASLRKSRIYYSEKTAKFPRNLKEFKEIASNFEGTIYEFLSKNLSLGKFYASEILKECSLNENLKVKEMDNYEISLLLEVLDKLLTSKSFYLFKKNSSYSTLIYFQKDYFSIEFEEINELFKTLFKLVVNKVKEEKVKEKEIKDIIKILENNKEIFESLLKKFSGKEESFIVNFSNYKIKLFSKKTFEENLEYYKSLLGKKEKEAIESLWYKNFRYFFSSDNFLIVLGTNNFKNEILIKKYLEKNDIVLKADIRGSPYCVIKSNGKEITQNTLKEASVVTACYSKAWLLNFKIIDVFYFKPEQIVKESWMKIGTFGIIGEKRKMENIKLTLCLGINSAGGMYCAPESLVKGKFEHIFYLYPGKLKINEIADYIERTINKPINRKLLKFFIPYGIAEIYYSTNE